MAEAIDSPIGFPSASKAPDPGISPPRHISLEQLHAWQISPAGMMAAHVAGLVSTIEELNNLSASPLGLALLAAELRDLEFVQTEIGQLMSRIHRSQGVAA
jgi:hypothetical protein